MLKKSHFKDIIHFFALYLPLVCLMITFPICDHHIRFLCYLSIICLIYIYFKHLYSIKYFVLIICCLCFGMFYYYFSNSFIYIYNTITQLYHETTNFYFPILTYTFVIYDIQSITMLCLLILSLFWMVLLDISIYSLKSHFITILLSFILGIPLFLYSLSFSKFILLILLCFWFFILCIPFQDDKILNLKHVFYQLICVIICCSVLLVCFSIQDFQSSMSPQDTMNLILKKEQGSSLNYHTQTKNLSNEGYIQYHNNVHFIIHSQEKKDMYLKLISYGMYESNQWSTIDENVYQTNQDIIHKEKVNNLESPYIQITDKRGIRDYALLPYQYNHVTQDLTLYHDIYSQFDSYISQYILDFKDYSDVLDNESFIENHYLQIPDINRSLFDQMNLKSTDMSRDEKISYIKSLFQNFTYTLKPGLTPQNEDFVNYFFEKSHRGYCVHFASTATLLLRYYGIPARYVEGYRVHHDDYNEDRAEILDSNAHAWAEIYDKDKGWIPLEFTIATSQYEDIPDNNPTNQDPLPNSQNNTINNNQNNQTIESSEEVYNFSIIEFIGFISIIILFIIMRFIIKRINYRRLAYDEKISIFIKYISSLKNKGFVYSHDVKSLLNKNQYNYTGLNDKEKEVLIHLLSNEFHNFFQELSFYQRFKYKYIKCFFYD